MLKALALSLLASFVSPLARADAPFSRKDCKSDEIFDPRLGSCQPLLPAEDSEGFALGLYRSDDLAVCDHDFYLLPNDRLMVNYSGSAFRNGRWGVCNGSSEVKKLNEHQYKVVEDNVLLTVLEPEKLQIRSSIWSAILRRIQ